jgi:hypothetical protein
MIVTIIITIIWRCYLIDTLRFNYINVIDLTVKDNLDIFYSDTIYTIIIYTFLNWENKIQLKHTGH